MKARGPLNIGSAEMISINDLVQTVAEMADKRISIKNVAGPEGARGRKSDNTLIRRELDWAASQSLRAGLEATYAWIAGEAASLASGSRRSDVNDLI